MIMKKYAVRLLAVLLCAALLLPLCAANAGGNEAGLDAALRAMKSAAAGHGTARIHAGGANGRGDYLRLGGEVTLYLPNGFILYEETPTSVALAYEPCTAVLGIYGDPYIPVEFSALALEATFNTTLGYVQSHGIDFYVGAAYSDGYYYKLATFCSDTTCYSFFFNCGYNYPELTDVFAKVLASIYLDGVSEDNPQTSLVKKVTSIELNRESLSLTRKSTGLKPTSTLKATVSPADADNPDVVWTSSNPKVATVSKNGKVTALRAGKTTVTCQSVSNPDVFATCKITVKDAKIKSFSAVRQFTDTNLKGKTVSLKKGKTITVNIANVKPSYAVNQQVTFKSSDRSVATVSKKGVITGVKKGTAKITVQSKDGGYKLTFTVRVK